jgi:hypothetical protein
MQSGVNMHQAGRGFTMDCLLISVEQNFGGYLTLTLGNKMDKRYVTEAPAYNIQGGNVFITNLPYYLGLLHQTSKECHNVMLFFNNNIIIINKYKMI